ncbi:MAG: hypothetical protein AAF677_02630 [Pseudomonadota bacterium]
MRVLCVASAEQPLRLIEGVSPSRRRVRPHQSAARAHIGLGRVSRFFRDYDLVVAMDGGAWSRLSALRPTEAPAALWRWDRLDRQTQEKINDLPDVDLVLAPPSPANDGEPIAEGTVQRVEPKKRDQTQVSAPVKLLLILFVISFFIPINLYLGELRLSVYRVLLLLMFFPSVIISIANADTRFSFADFAMICYALLGSWALLETGAEIPSAGIFIVEVLGPYYLARAFVTSFEHLLLVIRTWILFIAFTIPLAMYEAWTKDPIVLTFLGRFFDVIKNVPHEQRLGLDRAQVVFDHPIHYGMFCALAFGLAFMVSASRRQAQRSYINSGIVSVGAALSLSSGGFVGVGLQGALAAYDFVLRKVDKRWALMALGFFTLFVAIEVTAKRSFAEISIDFLALNPGTAWTRLIVNGVVMEEIAERPWFGLGLNEWERPRWLITGSIDNFWLATAFRHGIPTAVAVFLAMASVVIGLVRVRDEDERIDYAANGLLITIVSMSIAIVTVHLWNAPYVAYVFLLGSAGWLIDRSKRTRRTAKVEATKPRPILRTFGPRPPDRGARRDPEPAPVPDPLPDPLADPTPDPTLDGEPVLLVEDEAPPASDAEGPEAAWRPSDADAAPPPKDSA